MKSCSKGDKILTSDECRSACNERNIKGGVLKNGKACYMTGTKKCGQDGRNGPKASLICRDEVVQEELLLTGT